MDVPSAKTERIAAAAFDGFARLGMPAESSVSFPLPVRADLQLEAHVFIAVSRPTREGYNRQLFRPTTRVRLDWEGERVLAVHPPETLADYEPAGLLVSPAFAAEPTEESDLRLWDARHGLSLLLDEVGPIYGRGDDAPDLQGRCREAFRLIVPEHIRPLYEDLNADFLRWLEAGVP